MLSRNIHIFLHLSIIRISRTIFKGYLGYNLGGIYATQNDILLNALFVYRFNATLQMMRSK